MTTVFVSKSLGLAMTDSRVTESTPRFFAGFFPLTHSVQYKVTNQKAIYIHDRLFVAAGDVSTINRIIRYLVNHEEVLVTKNTPECECMLIGKDYAIYMYVFKGKFHKKTIFFGDNWVSILGSGYDAIAHLKYSTRHNPFIFTAEHVIEEFRKVKDKDKFTDDNINLYRI